MITYECEGRPAPIHADIKADTPHEAARLFREANGLWPDSVGDEIVMGVCEVCGNPLFTSDQYVSDSEGVMWCNDEQACADRSTAGEKVGAARQEW